VQNVARNLRIFQYVCHIDLGTALEPLDRDVPGGVRADAGARQLGRLSRAAPTKSASVRYGDSPFTTIT